MSRSVCTRRVTVPQPTSLLALLDQRPKPPRGHLSNLYGGGDGGSGAPYNTPAAAQQGGDGGATSAVTSPRAATPGGAELSHSNTMRGSTPASPRGEASAGHVGGGGGGGGGEHEEAGGGHEGSRTRKRGKPWAGNRQVRLQPCPGSDCSGSDTRTWRADMLT